MTRSIRTVKGGVAMGGTIRARVRGGVLEPIERLDLPEGKEVTVTILDLTPGRDPDAFLRSRGGWKRLIDAKTMIRNIRETRHALSGPVQDR
jgi:predicted DNA-binding antitoxin AbrB/MazE fold protein